jgi:CCR4-NOT complex subunit CAF16
MDPFTTTLPHVTYLGMEWVLNPTVRSDISVTTLLSSVGGDAYPDRRDVLIEILDVDTAWHMHSVSDGERRRVQLAMGLIRPWNVLLLDEVTVDLDVLARHRFLAFLKAECESRGATVVYATHVVECLNGWASHVCRVAAGKIKMVGEMEAVLMQERRRLGVKEDTGLLTIAVKWLEEDLIERGPRRGGKSESVAYGDVVKVDFSIKR